MRIEVRRRESVGELEVDLEVSIEQKESKFDTELVDGLCYLFKKLDEGKKVVK